MKRIVSLLLAILLMTTVVFADGKIPAALSQMVTNYSADYVVSLSFDNCDSIIALLEEIEFPDEVSNFIDLKQLLKTLFTYEQKMEVRANINDDLTKIQLSMEAQSQHNVVFNNNLNVNIDAKTGMWLDMDLTDKDNMKFEIIYSMPYLNKYMVIDLAEQPEFKESLVLFTKIFNKKFIETINSYSYDAIENYADVSVFGGKCIITFDNDGFTSYTDKVIPYVVAAMKGFMPEGTEIEIPSIKGWKLLGDNGLKYIYSLRGDVLTGCDMKADISVSIAEIYESITGEKWDKSVSTIDFTYSMEADMKNIGKTTVAFPELTEENSFNISDMQPEYTAQPEEYVPDYPNFFIWAESNDLPIIDGEIYVPLRATFDNAYDYNAAIEYSNGIITVNCPYFEDFTQLKLTVGDDKAYKDNVEYYVGKIVETDGTTYVNNNFFNQLFGWEFEYATYDMLNKTYSYEFYAY